MIGRCTLEKIEAWAPRITLDVAPDGKTIRGFVVTVESPTQDEALDKARTKAKMLADILAYGLEDTSALRLEVLK